MQFIVRMTKFSTLRVKKWEENQTFRGFSLFFSGLKATSCILLTNKEEEAPLKRLVFLLCGYVQHE